MLIYRSFLILGAKALKRTVNLNKFGKKVLVWISQGAEDGAQFLDLHDYLTSMVHYLCGANLEGKNLELLKVLVLAYCLGLNSGLTFGERSIIDLYIENHYMYAYYDNSCLSPSVSNLWKMTGKEMVCHPSRIGKYLPIIKVWLTC